MSERTARGLAWLAAGLYALLLVSSLVFNLATKPTRGHPDSAWGTAIVASQTELGVEGEAVFALAEMA